VLEDLDRFGPYAEEACAGANGILVGSGHIAARLRQAVDDPETNAKVRLGPPGVDTELFAPMPVAERARQLRGLAEQLRVDLGEKFSHREKNSPKAAGSAWDRDPAAAAEALEWFADGDGPRVIFVGKLIVSKGVDLLLAAWPVVHAAHPDARLLIVGFGALEAALHRVWEGLGTGDVGPLAQLAERGRGLEGGEDESLPILTAFLSQLPHAYEELAAAASGSVRFAGRLEHDEVAVPVAASDALVFPSTFPEAFGMVAAEAASAGVLPVSAAHSGAAEVSAALAAELPPASRDLVSFELGTEAVASIAERLRAWLALPADERAEARRALRATVDRLWSWEGVARGVLAASTGELDDLPAPSD
jgi:glycosyltransferase involved in cell wall biosynthesis